MALIVTALAMGVNSWFCLGNIRGKDYLCCYFGRTWFSVSMEVLIMLTNALYRWGEVGKV